MSLIEKIKMIENLFSDNIFRISFEFYGDEKIFNETEKEALRATGFCLNWAIKIHYTVQKENGFVVEDMVLGYGNTLEEAIDNAFTDKKWLKLK